MWESTKTILVKIIYKHFLALATRIKNNQAQDNYSSFVLIYKDLGHVQIYNSCTCEYTQTYTYRQPATILHHNIAFSYSSQSEWNIFMSDHVRPLGRA